MSEYRLVPLLSAVEDRKSSYDSSVQVAESMCEVMAVAAESLADSEPSDTSKSNEMIETYTKMLHLTSSLQCRSMAMLRLATELRVIPVEQLGSSADYDFKSQLDHFQQEIEASEIPANAQKNKHAIKELKKKVWSASHTNELMPQDEDIEDSKDCDDYLQIVGDVDTTHCPITKAFITDAVSNTKCGHIYSRVGIRSFLQDEVEFKNCPVAGCHETVSATTIEVNRRVNQRLRRLRKQRIQKEDDEDVIDFTQTASINKE